MENRIQHYAWGSPTVIPVLLGYPPDGTPAAELWMGVHPGAPSTVVSPGPRRPLGELIGDDPRRLLGGPAAERVGNLPFLVKILAVDRPLSLQAHPDRAQARAGFQEENERGVPVDAPNRNYRDVNHKPEMVCAVTEFTALSGFRPVHDTVRMLDGLGPAVVRRYRARLLAPGGLRDVVTGILTLPAPVMAEVVDGVAEAATALAHDGGEFAAEAAWLVTLAQAYPGDRGIMVAALLNLVRLPPGGVLTVPAGQLHAYLGGVGVEIMATSDNVLRGGLTPKHIDVGELVRILDLTEDPAPPVELPSATGGWADYRSDFPDFRLSRAELAEDGVREVTRDPGAAQIILCTAGAASVIDRAGVATEVSGGASVFVPADEAVRVRLGAAAAATVFAASTNLAS